MKQIMSFDYDEGESKEIEIKLDEYKRRRRNKLAKEQAEAEIFAKMGAKVMNLKNKSAALIGKYADRLGIKHIGHGKILSASDHAETTIEELDAIIEEFRTNSEKCDPETLAVFMQLKRDFTRILMETGEAHLKAANQANADPKDGTVKPPFPMGKSMTIVVGSTSVPPPAQIEQPKSEG